jgi:hypothetical protein
METDLIDQLGLAGFGAAFLLSTLAVSELGLRLGRWYEPRFDDPGRSEVSTIQSGVLGILALLLGFSFAMAVSRYDLRKQLVVEEANAIGTTHLRTRTLPDPEGRELRALLERYVSLRVALIGADRETLRRRIAESEHLQVELWSKAAAVAVRDPHSIMAGLLLQSLNDTIDLHAKRKMARTNHVPTAVIAALFLSTVVAMAFVGFGLGLGVRRAFLTRLILSLLITLIVLIIADLDRPDRGIIRVSQAAMLDLQRGFRDQPVP